jgi:hypothetical protein
MQNRLAPSPLIGAGLIFLKIPHCFIKKSDEFNTPCVEDWQTFDSFLCQQKTENTTALIARIADQAKKFGLANWEAG